MGFDAGGPLRIGLLGAARITERAVVTPARETGDRLVAVAARDRDRAAAFAERHGVERAVADYAALVAAEDVEVVYNPLANALHAPWNLAAIAAGKHVLSEKPFAANAGEARVVASAARTAGVTVVEAFHYVHHPVMRRMHTLVGSGELGALRHVEAHVTMTPPPDDDPRWSWELAGGAVMDLGCYALHACRSLARWAGGEPGVTGARAQERPGHEGVDEWLEADLGFPGGASGFVRCSMNDDWRATLRVVGEAGEAIAANFVLPHRDDRVHVRTKTGQRTEELGRRSSYHFQLAALRVALRGDAETDAETGAETGAEATAQIGAGLDDAVANAELIDAAYLAAGFPVRPALAVPIDRAVLTSSALPTNAEVSSCVSD
jgi:predicted dehydrogenase